MIDQQTADLHAIIKRQEEDLEVLQERVMVLRAEIRRTLSRLEYCGEFHRPTINRLSRILEASDG